LPVFFKKQLQHELSQSNNPPPMPEKIDDAKDRQSGGVHSYVAE
jgi:hypothetical protein